MVSLFSRLIVPVALLSLALAACDACDLTIVTDSLPDGVVGRPYSFELEEDCGGDVWFLAEGSLPPGISLTEEGLLAGTPSRAGEFIFTVGLEDFYGRHVVKGFSLTIKDSAAPPPAPPGD
jgi:hypothetical protein